MFKSYLWIISNNYNWQKLFFLRMVSIIEQNHKVKKRVIWPLTFSIIRLKHPQQQQCYWTVTSHHNFAQKQNANLISHTLCLQTIDWQYFVYNSDKINCIIVIFGKQHRESNAKLPIYSYCPHHLINAATLPCKMICSLYFKPEHQCRSSARKQSAHNWLCSQQKQKKQKVSI